MSFAQVGVLLAVVCALLAPPVQAFVGPTVHVAGRQVTSTLVRSSSICSLRMAEEADEVSSGPTAEEISKGIAHPAAVFTVPENILKVLPHRYPFALVDKVLHFEAGKRIVGVKCITNNEPQFTGHFPDLPIMPGVLQVEAMAQLGGLICLQEPCSNGEGNFFFAGVDGVKWKKPVVPGDVLVMEMELLKWKPKFGIAKMTGRAYVDGILAVDVQEFTFALAK